MNSDFRAALTARYMSYVVVFILVLLPFHELLAILIGSHTGHLDLVRIWKEILITAMLVPAGWLVFRSAELRHWVTSSWIVRLYALYLLLHLALGAYALATHEVNASALIYGLLVNLRFIGFFILCSIVAASDRWLRDYWAKLVLWPAAVVIIFGLMQRFLLPLDFLKHFGYGPTTIPAYQTIDNNNNYQRIQSTLRGANPLGAYLVLVITGAVVKLKTKSILKPLFILAATGTIFLTYSRSAWIGLFISLAVLFYLEHERKISRRFVYIFVSGLIVIGGGLYLVRDYQPVQDALLHTSKTSTSAKSSNAQRSSALKSGIRDVVHQPLGRGPGTAGPASERNSGHAPRIAEDYYLQLGQEVGLIGLGLFVTINLLVARQLWLLRQDSLARSLLAGFIGICFINLLSHAWADDSLSLLWWGLAGVASAPVILIKKNKRSET
ncbi:MAG TPA: O-antigen ligase family protein [Candidatus Saccharimonadales bacterium]|nr:O-antigen ligase family protein [Candidatus Saccharimonadales bacterium]